MAILLFCLLFTIVQSLGSFPQICLTIPNNLESGWKSESIDEILDSNKCDFERRKGPLTQQEFESEYSEKKPVILENVSKNELFQQLCSRDYLLQNFGHKEVVLSTANTHSYTKIRFPLSQYIAFHMSPTTLNVSADTSLYHFGDNNFADWGDFFTYYVRPPFEDSDTKGSLSFGLAGSGSGVPFHTHGAVFAEVLHGKKRWFLYPPKSPPEFDPNETSLSWFFTKYSQLPEEKKPLECVLKPGEVIYFPTGWHHSTLNIGQSVFISTFV